MTPASPQPSTGSRVAASAAKGGCLLGLIGFAGGFFGPMIFTAEANQDPMLGILITGPAGLVLGLLIGAVVGWSRRNEVVPQVSGPPKHQRLWLWLKTDEDGTAVFFLLLLMAPITALNGLGGVAGGRLRR